MLPHSETARARARDTIPSAWCAAPGRGIFLAIFLILLGVHQSQRLALDIGVPSRIKQRAQRYLNIVADQAAILFRGAVHKAHGIAAE